MNWKMNIWTLLFALATTGLLYQNACNPQPSPSPSSGCQPDSIPFKTAEGYMIGYTGWMGYQAEHKDTARHYGIKNSDIMYFAMDSCELAEMVAFAQHGKVYAFLGVKDSLIHLILLDDNPLLPSAHSIRAFDFSKPCPPVCDTTGMTQ